MILKQILTRDDILLKKLNGELQNSQDWDNLNDYILTEDAITYFKQYFTKDVIYRRQTLSDDFIKNELQIMSDTNDYEQLITLIHYQSLSINNLNIIFSLLNHNCLTKNENMLINNIFSLQIVTDEMLKHYINDITISSLQRCIENNSFSLDTLKCIKSKYHYSSTICNCIYEYNELPEDFIESDNADNYLIFTTQHLSEDYFKRHSKSLTNDDIINMIQYQNLSKDFLQRNMRNFNALQRNIIKQKYKYNLNFNVQYIPDEMC